MVLQGRGRELGRQVRLCVHLVPVRMIYLLEAILPTEGLSWVDVISCLSSTAVYFMAIGQGSDAHST